MQAYSEPFVSLVYFENLAYSEQLYIQKPEIFSNIYDGAFCEYS